MNKLLLSTFLIFVFFACNEKSHDSSNAPTSDIEIVTENAKYSAVALNFERQSIIDSSGWILYELPLMELEKSGKGFKSISYDYGGRGNAAWNVAFYNINTKETRLLSDSLKMVILGVFPLANKIYYRIITTDYNQDGKLNFNDNSIYLFVSDVSGENFKQISPNNFNLVEWNVIDSGNKILIQANSYKNGEVEETVNFIYDIEKETIEQIFNQEFILKTKKLLEKHWAKN